MRILITGASGFLGKKAYDFFKEKYVVKGLARTSIKTGDLECYGSDDLDGISFAPDMVLMCHAAISSGRDNAAIDTLFESNVALTKAVCHRFPEAKIIYISTVSIYRPGDLIKEHSPILPATDYALSKLWGENIVLERKKAAVLRISSMYGEGMKPNTIIPFLVQQALKKGRMTLWGDGSRKQNYIHVMDVIGYINAIITNFTPVDKAILLGVSSKEYSNAELAAVISDHTGAQIVFEGEDKSQSFHYNNQSTNEALRYESEIPFTEGIVNYIKCQEKKY